MATYEVIGVGQHKKYFDEGAYSDTISYIFRPDHAACIGGDNIYNLNNAAAEMLAVAIKFKKNSGKRVRHSVLSFSKQEMYWMTPELAENYAKGVIAFYADEYQIVYAVHTNTDNLHIHFVMNQISFVDGHRYAGKKQDYYAFQKYLKELFQIPIYTVKKNSYQD